ncbi:MAG TPA: 3-phosphoshikimate 1-carboxyvinyltransferase [Thermoanaerobaculaceae bacterium]|nr:3-phosphoshikimate 1-carboxyvinyltransferase [Thermoanaerobaculaceae bacterium]HRS14716.1 3-phosphoshikimate 1-carboxyvinyltransferase [Thermoanaerobaculaceae bacterium]
MSDEVRLLRHAPDGAHGQIHVPSSKSLTQRALVAAARAGGGARIGRPLDAEDPRLLFRALLAAGFAMTWEDEAVAASGHVPVERGELELSNNGTGLRLLLAQLAVLPGQFRVDGSLRLRERPLKPLLAALRQLGAEVEPEVAGAGERLPLVVRGRPLPGGAIELDAAASSQFVSALLMLAPLLAEGLEVRVPAAPPSRPYIDLTVEVLRCFGVAVACRPDGLAWRVEPGGFRPASYEVEADWSAAAFPLVAAALVGGAVEVPGLRYPSPQGDARVLDLLVSAGCRPFVTRGGVRLEGPADRPLEADLRDTPDLFPVLAVALTRLGGRLTGLGGLVHKESDRLAEMVRLLAEMGAELRVAGDEVSAPGGGRLVAPPHPLDPAGDHRLAMALAVAGCVAPGLRLASPGCVAKSWPAFWTAWDGLLEQG